MAIPLIPLLALLAGGFVLTRGKKTARRCTPESILGKGYAHPSKGGYPMLAAGYVEEWMEIAAASGASHHHLTAMKSELKFEADRRDVSWEAYNSVAELGNESDTDAAYESYSLVKDRMNQVRSTIHAESWRIADKILTSMNCPKLTGSSESVKTILANKESHLRWLLAIGAWINITSVLNYGEWKVSDPEFALMDATDFVSHHFSRGLSGNKANGAAEVAKYVGLTTPKLSPFPGEVAILNERNAIMEDTPGQVAFWQFKPITIGGAPLTQLESDLNDVAADVLEFLFGVDPEVPDTESPRTRVIHSALGSNWLMGNPNLFGWFALKLSGQRTKTIAGMFFTQVLVDNMTNGYNPRAYPAPLDLDGASGPAIETVAAAINSMPLSSVRGLASDNPAQDSAFWDQYIPSIKACQEAGLGVHEIAAMMLDNQPFEDACVPGSGYTRGRVASLYPSYTRWFDENPGTDYDDFIVATDSFIAQYPIIHAAIVNMAQMIYRRVETTGDWGDEFGG